MEGSELDGMPEAERRLMRMRIGAGVARRLGEGLMIDSSPAGSLASRLAHPSSVVTHGWATMVEVDAEPWEWEVLARWLKRNGVVRPSDSATLRNRARGFVNLARRIDVELDRLARAPGYRSMMVAGVHPILLPAFRCGERYAPTPGRIGCEEPEAGEMVPYTVRVRNRTFTGWTFLPSDGRPGTVEGGGAGE